jgi:hypothetical protein
MQMPRPDRALFPSLLAAVAALAIAGCGGDDDTSSTTGTSGATGVSGTPLSQDEFVSQVNAICADGNDQVEALGTPPNDIKGLGDYAQQVLDISEPLLAQLEAITPPEDQQADYDAYVAAVNDQAELDQQLATAAQAGDTKEVQSIAQQLQANDTDSQAEALGLTECASDPEPQG